MWFVQGLSLLRRRAGYRVLRSPIPCPVSQTIAFAVVQTKCLDGDNAARPSKQHLQRCDARNHRGGDRSAGGTGWINNSVVTEAEGDDFFEQIAASFSAIEIDLRVGEVADICQAGVLRPDPPASKHPTQPIPIATSDPSLEASSSSHRTGRTTLLAARHSCQRRRWSSARRGSSSSSRRRRR